MIFGVIADDLTGASDIAGFIATEGLSVIQYVGIPASTAGPECDVAVISLKSRSVPAEQAVRDSLAALDWLLRAKCPRIYLKYCSTFDSTDQGNIGPVTDAILKKLGLNFTVICPALPANGRTVRDGILYVNGVPLSETGMRNHPLNPMTDSDLVRLMEAQADGEAGLVPLSTVRQGNEAVAGRLGQLQEKGVRYAVLDGETDADMDVLGAALRDAPFLTGGSSLGAAVCRRLVADGMAIRRNGVTDRFNAGKTIILSGSCSEMTNRQVEYYRSHAPEFRVSADKCMARVEEYAAEAAKWVTVHSGGPNAVMVNAMVRPDELKGIQNRHGATKAAEAVETFFRFLAVKLGEAEFVNYIVAGGETSGSVAGALGVKAFRIGPQIAPGVSWVFAVDKPPLALAMKSGNFGDEAFFIKAQSLMHWEGKKT